MEERYVGELNTEFFSAIPTSSTSLATPTSPASLATLLPLPQPRQLLPLPQHLLHPESLSSCLLFLGRSLSLSDQLNLSEVKWCTTSSSTAHKRNLCVKSTYSVSLSHTHAHKHTHKCMHTHHTNTHTYTPHAHTCTHTHHAHKNAHSKCLPHLSHPHHLQDFCLVAEESSLLMGQQWQI